MSDFKFDRQVFLGNGAHSGRDVQAIHKKLDEAISLLGGLQQPPMATMETTPEIKAQYDEGEQELYKLTRQIVRALTGKEIDFK